MRLPRYLVPGLLVALAAVVMGFRLTNKDLWNDEAFSYFVARHGPAAAARFIVQDTQPPVYYLILSVWLQLGRSAVVLRSLSVAALALAVLPLYGAARRLFDAQVAGVAGAFFVLTPLVVGWAQKARPYAVQTLFLAIAYWGFVEVYRSAAAREAWIGASLRRGVGRVDLGWGALALGGGMAMLTQQPAGFFLLGLNVTALLVVLRRGPGWGRFLANWTVSQMLLIGVWLLWLPWFLRQIGTNLTPAQIAVRHPNFLIGGDQVLGYLRGLFGVGSLWRAEPLFLAVQLAAALAGCVMLRRGGRATPVLAPLLVPPAVGLVGFWLIHPVFGYVIGEFVFLWLPYSILLGYAVARLPWRFVGVAVAAVILLGDAWGLRNYYETPNQPTAQVAAVIAAGMRPGDGVILAENTAMRWALAYYLGPARRHLLVGLDVSAEWDYDRLLRTRAAALRQTRNWVVLPGNGQPVAVDPGVLQADMRQVSAVRRGSASVRLFVERPGGQ